MALQNVRVFESLLPAVTLVALGLLVPAAVVAMLLARGRHASTSVGGDRGGRVAIAAAVVALCGGTVSWLLGSGVVATVVAALILAVPVAVWAFLAPWWPVRAVVAWAMLVTGTVGTVAMAAAFALQSTEPWTSLPVAASGSAVAVFVLGRLNGPFRRLLGIRAGIRRAVRTPLLLRPTLLRPALAVAVFFAALAAGGLTGVAPRPGDRATPQSGSGPEPGGPGRGPAALDGADVRAVSAQTATPSEAARVADRLRSEPGSGAEAGTADGSADPSSGTGSSDRTGTGGGTAAGAGTTDGAGGSRTPTASSGSGDTGPTGGNGTPDGPVTQVTDTVADTAETVVDTVEGTTDPVTGGEIDVPEPVGSVVEETVEPVQAVVEETVEQVTDPLASTLP